MWFAELYSYTEHSDFALNKQAFQEHFEQYGMYESYFYNINKLAISIM